MAKPIFSAEEMADFNAKLKEINNDRVSYPEWKDREKAINNVRGAFFAQAVSRIRAERMEEFLNYLLIIAGTKGERADIIVWGGFSESDKEAYIKLLEKCDTPINRRYLHMFLKAILVAHRSWALTAFVKFLRGNKVAGGKANELKEFGSFHKDSGWNEAQVKAVGDVLFDERSLVSKLFMQYDSDIKDQIYEESQKEDSEVPCNAKFAATGKIVNKEFINELISSLEKRELAPMPSNSKKAFKPHVPKIFKEGDVIKKNTIIDLPPLSIIELAVTARMKSGDKNAPGTVQIILLEPPEPRCYLNIWRIVGDEARLPGRSFPDFDRERESLEGAIFKGLWTRGVAAQKGPYQYPHNYINIQSR